MRLLRLGFALIAILAGCSAAAAQQTPNLSEIATALAEERAQIAALRAELDRRDARLAELTARLSTATNVIEPAAPEAKPAPPPVVLSQPTAVPRFQFYADSRVRYETLHQEYEGCDGCPDRKRGRLRLRFGAEGHVTPDFTAVIGLGLGEISDPNTVYANLGNNFSRKVASWDRGYVEYHPSKVKWMRLMAGKFPYTWQRSSMTFDVDFYPEGLNQRFSFDLGSSAVKSVGAQAFELIVNEQPGDRHMTIVGGQLTAAISAIPKVVTRIAVTGLDIDNPEFMLRALLDGTDTGVRNTNAVLGTGPAAQLLSGYRYANVIVDNAVATPWPKLPIIFGFEYQKNLEAANDRDKGLSFRVDAGRAQRRGDWDGGWHVFRVEQDAILAGLGESDWRAPSNVLQHRFALNRMMNENVQLGFTLYRGRTLDPTLRGALTAPNFVPGIREPWMNRAYFDITYRYWRAMDSVGSPGIVDHEAPRAVCLTTQNIPVAAGQCHRLAI